MAWFDDLKRALPGYYPAGTGADIVGYLKGSSSAAVWRQMATGSGRHQMLVLGSKEPTKADWVAAGVDDRGLSQTVKFSMLQGFIVLYGGFPTRPWGQIHAATPDAIAGFPASLATWKRNYLKPK